MAYIDGRIARAVQWDVAQLKRNLTARQAIEAEIYDAKAAAADIADRDLIVDASTYPIPNREHADFLPYAIDLLQPMAGKEMLEIGSGTGYTSVYFARRGAAVLGIDVSEECVMLARRRARVNGVEGLARFESIPVEEMEGAAGSFDAIFGNQILHHLDLETAAGVLRRMLKPGGKGVFCEPVLLPTLLQRARHTPLALRVLPHFVHTPTERSLNYGDLKLLRRHFDAVRVREFQLFTRVVRWASVSDLVFSRVMRMDDALLRRVPWLRSFCLFLVIELS